MAEKKRKILNILRKEPDYIETEEAEELQVKENNKTGDSYLPALRMFSPMQNNNRQIDKAWQDDFKTTQSNNSKTPKTLRMGNYKVVQNRTQSLAER